MEEKTTAIVFWGSKYCFLWFPLNGLVNPSLSRRDANMTGLREREEGGRNGEGIIDKINALAFIPFIRMKALVLLLFPFFPCASVGLSVALTVWGLCTVSRSERKSKRGVKLTSWFGNILIHGRFHICASNAAQGSNIPQICSIQGAWKGQKVTF